MNMITLGSAPNDLRESPQSWATQLGSFTGLRAGFATATVNFRKKDPKILQNEAKNSLRINKAAPKPVKNEANLEPYFDPKQP